MGLDFSSISSCGLEEFSGILRHQFTYRLVRFLKLKSPGELEVGRARRDISDPTAEKKKMKLRK